MIRHPIFTSGWRSYPPTDGWAHLDFTWGVVDGCQARELPQNRPQLAGVQYPWVYLAGYVIAYLTSHPKGYR